MEKSTPKSHKVPAILSDNQELWMVALFSEWQEAFYGLQVGAFCI